MGEETKGRKNKNTQEKNLYTLLDQLNISEEEITTIIDMPSTISTFSAGPGTYPGGRYGTISINDF